MNAKRVENDRESQIRRRPLGWSLLAMLLLMHPATAHAQLQGYLQLLQDDQALKRDFDRHNRDTSAINRRADDYRARYPNVTQSEYQAIETERQRVLAERASLTSRRSAMIARKEKFFGSREEKATTARITFNDLAEDEKYAKEPDGQTHCSEFVRDAAAKLIGKPVPELNGQAKDQFDQLTAAAAKPDGDWVSLDFNKNPSHALITAHQLALQGYVVVGAYKNPNWMTEPGNTGHTFLFAPVKEMEASGTNAWNMNVPFVAQAGGFELEKGKTVYSKLKFSYALRPDMAPHTNVFVYRR